MTATAIPNVAPVPRLRRGIEGITLDLPLLNDLHRLSHEAKRRFPNPRNEGFGRIGLYLETELAPGGYWCSPKNAVVFASTGGDGDHYSLLIRENRIDERSPVLLTYSVEGTQQVVGENLFDFLCLGMHGGYFQVNSVFSQSPPANGPEHWFCEHVDEHERMLLSYLASELKLRPWTDRGKYRRLQEEFLSLVVVSGR